jgi:hypothetical protein
MGPNHRDLKLRRFNVRLGSTVRNEISNEPLWTIHLENPLALAVRLGEQLDRIGSRLPAI